MNKEMYTLKVLINLLKTNELNLGEFFDEHVIRSHSYPNFVDQHYRLLSPRSYHEFYKNTDYIDNLLARIDANSEKMRLFTPQAWAKLSEKVKLEILEKILYCHEYFYNNRFSLLFSDVSTHHFGLHGIRHTVDWDKNTIAECKYKNKKHLTSDELYSFGLEALPNICNLEKMQTEILMILDSNQ